VAITPTPTTKQLPRSDHGPRPTTPDRIDKVLTTLVGRNLWLSQITKSIFAQILCVNLLQTAEMYIPVKNSVASFSGGLGQTALDVLHIH